MFERCDISSAGPDGHQDDRDESAIAHWTEREVDKTAFEDVRLGQRFGELLRQIGDGMGGSIPFAGQDWANTKAADRFFANERVEEAGILSGHFAATRTRYDDCTGPILLIQDTTEFSYQRANTSAIGITESVNSGRDKGSRWRHQTVCGMLMHSSLAVTVEGLPLGSAAVKFWTRKKFKGTAQLKKKIKPDPRAHREGERSMARQSQAIDRTARTAGALHSYRRPRKRHLRIVLPDARAWRSLPCPRLRRSVGRRWRPYDCDRDGRDQRQGPALHRRAGRQGRDDESRAGNQVQADCGLASDRKANRYPALDLTVIHASERGATKGRKPIEWKLITDRPVRGRSEAIEKINWYAMRWIIEMFHKILKSGCRAEDSKLRAAERLANLMAVFCILGWRVTLAHHAQSHGPGRVTEDGFDGHRDRIAR